MWLHAGSLQMDTFEAHPEAYSELLVTGIAQRVIMCMCYNAAVRMRLMVPLEKLPTEQKNLIWEQTKRVAAGRCDQWKLVELSKCLYTIQEFMTK